ncbi:basic amino acid ABC transporter substrate-binding protein [Metasolibacillus meyeri]|uniref:basic amino acid ABC transporter substrate-binding protein n=1 Tax=Metasolibacillus meyeri TaxID=1071052 RepID=UPI000D304D18|nr:basic amino acid ABC transporter substrate-binding protein [Metasolibacillus meyeri]
MKQKFSVLLMIITAVLVLAACGTKDNNSGSDSGSGDDNKVYMVGTEATFAPFESIDAAGNIVGIDVDILQAIADEVGIQVQWRNVGWDAVFSMINNKETDIGASGITITEDRQKTFDFTEPYYESKLLIAVPVDSTISSLAELENKKIAVQINATGHVAAKKLQGETSKNILAFDSQPLAIQEMLNGNADAVIGDNAVVYEYMKANPDKKLKIVEDDAFEREYYGLMVRKGNKELLDKLNEGLQKIKENGKLEEITGSAFWNE